MTAALSKFSKCSSVKEFLFLDLMLFTAENTASHTCASKHSQHFLAVLDNFRKLSFRNISHPELGWCTVVLPVLQCCVLLQVNISSCTAASSPPNSCIFVAVVVTSQTNGLSTKCSTRISGRILFQRTAAGQIKCAGGPHVGQHGVE